MKRCGLLWLLAVLVAVGPAVAQEAASMTMQQFDQMLNQKLDANTILGTPIKVGDMTLIPVVMKFFAIGVANGQRASEGPAGPPPRPAPPAKPGENAPPPPPAPPMKSDSVEREAFGGIGCVRPVSLIIINKDGAVRIQDLKSNIMVTIMERVMPLVKQALEQRWEMMKLRFFGGGAGAGSGSGAK